MAANSGEGGRIAGSLALDAPTRKHDSEAQIAHSKVSQLPQALVPMPDEVGSDKMAEWCGMGLDAYLFVGTGGAIGGAARFIVSDAVGRRWGTAFPYGTLAVNVTGALLIGIVAGLARASIGTFDNRLTQDLFITGILGGYTTVSSFSMQTLNLVLANERRLAFLNVGGSTVLCLLAVAFGYLTIVRAFA
jgi:CrcB protein